MSSSTYRVCRVLRRLTGAVVLLLSGAAWAAGPAVWHGIQDPHYGDSLFHFYQERYFTAVTGLMVSQHFGRVSHHADEAEILRGGLLLSYGMHREAGEIFTRLIEPGAPPSVRDRAWYYLAKIRYQRGLLREAEEAIGRVEKPLAPDLEDDRGLLKANLLMARGDYAGAVDVLNGMTRAANAGRYARFNLGVALIKHGDAARGKTMLDELGKAPVAPGADLDEQRSLRDQANVALGYAALRDSQPESARIYLERVRLSGLQANKALLGFGWAAAQMKDYRQALVPWSELSQRDASDAAVLEAGIAMPYAFAKLGAYGQSLASYNDAISLFERESVKLDESMVGIRAGKLVHGLIERNPGEEMGWFWRFGELPELPHAGHLTQVLAQHEFQEGFKNFRDLQFLSRNLQGWNDKLGVFGDMLENRRNAYADRLPKLLGQARDIDLQGLQRRRDDAAAELKRAVEDADGSAFADAKERQLLARLANAQGILQGLGGGPELDAARERHRLAAGALVWQLAQAYPARVWDARKGLKATDAGLSKAHTLEASLAQAQRDEPARFERFAERIAELDKRIQALIPQVAALGREQQHHVQELAVSQLMRQKERLADYTLQARFAVAQILDRAHKAKDADHAPKP